VEAAALGLRVDGVDGIDRASSSLDRLSKSAKGAENASGQLDRASKSSSRSISDVSRESDRASRSMATLSAAIRPVAAGLAAAFSVRALTQYADTWSDMTSLVRVNIGAHEDAAEVMGRLADIARGTYSSLELTAQGFAQNAFTLNALGKSTKQQLDYTSALNNALVVSGAKGQQAQMVQDSLNRAMAEGSLRGQELQNVLNYGSTVAGLLAEELGVNVTQLRELAKEGRITADVIFNALVKNMEQLEETAESMPATIGDGFLLLRNSVLQAVGVFDQANGLSEEFAENLVGIADAIRDTDWGPYIRALTTGAKIAAAYVAAIYAIPVAKAAAAAATAGYQAVLAAFSAQAAVTTAQLWSMNTALGVVGAAFAGFQIGTYLRNEFEIVEKAGIALMGGLHTMAVQVAGFFRVMGENIKFAVMNPIDAARGAIADMLEWLARLGRDALGFLGLEGLAAGIQTEFAGIRGATAAEHKATLEEIRNNTASEVDMVRSIYADMFADVGKNAEEAASATEELSNTTNNLTNNVENLAAAQNALKQAFEQTLAGYHRQLTLAEDASEVEQLLYEIQYGRLQGLLPAQQEMLRGMAEELDMRNKLAQIEADRLEEEEAYLQLVKDLRTEEERLTDEFHERIAVLDAMAASTRIASDEYAEMASRVAEAAFTAAPKFGGLAPEVGGPLGELLKIDEAQENLQLWYDTQLEMLNEFRAERSDLNAQWDAQEEALKQEHEAKLAEIEKARHLASLGLAGDFFGQMSALQKSESSKARTIGKAAAIAEATINTYRAATGAYAAMAGIPVVGPALGVAAAGAAIAAGMANVAAIQGQAHDGIMSIPEDGTWLLKKGERVTTAETSAKLDRTLDEVMGRMQALPTNVIPFPSQPSSNVGNSTNVVVNVHNAPPGTQVEQSTSQDGTDVIDIWIADFTAGGRTASAVQGKFGLQPQGR